MSLFLRLSERYGQAISTYDPLKGEWLCRIIDPLSKQDQECKPSVMRPALLLLLAYGPIWLFCSLPYPSCGGPLLGTHGLLVDVALHGMLLFTMLCLALIPIARRVLGALINELVALNIVDNQLYRFRPRLAPNNCVLTILEIVSRINGHRGLFWFGGLVVLNLALGQYAVLADAIPRWSLTPSEPGTAFHFLSVGTVQPNLAGIWSFAVFIPLTAYMLLPVARLVIVFACLCGEVAQNKSLIITPAHPDGTGGLRPIGQAALFFSVFTFALGVDLAGITINEFILQARFPAGAYRTSSILPELFGYWICYLVLGTLLFVLPLLPLRIRMARGKRVYLLAALRLKAVAEERQRREFEENRFRPDSLQGMVALDALIETATGMAVWPFDRKTFARYAGLLISPMLPVIADKLPVVLEWTGGFLRGH